MPYVSEVPDSIDIDHLETPSPLNPLGIKGAGEAGVIPCSAVFASAIEDIIPVFQVDQSVGRIVLSHRVLPPLKRDLCLCVNIFIPKGTMPNQRTPQEGRCCLRLIRSSLRRSLGVSIYFTIS